jgi:hypothetical protein
VSRIVSRTWARYSVPPAAADASTVPESVVAAPSRLSWLPKEEL